MSAKVSRGSAKESASACSITRAAASSASKSARAFALNSGSSAGHWFSP
ncbi:MAG: hypothetical protein AB1730_16135 [Myxococcota bacterium]|jgi:hypothetical protein